MLDLIIIIFLMLSFFIIIFIIHFIAIINFIELFRKVNFFIFNFIFKKTKFILLYFYDFIASYY